MLNCFKHWFSVGLAVGSYWFSLDLVLAWRFLAGLGLDEKSAILVVAVYVHFLEVALGARRSREKANFDRVHLFIGERD